MSNICANNAFLAFGKGDAIYCERYGNGHINETYLCKTENAAYIL